MSLDLDPRQRAMLEEMGIKLWLPGDAAQRPNGSGATAQVKAGSAAPAPAAAQTASMPRPSPPSARPLLATPPAGLSGAPFPPEARPEGIASMDWQALQGAVSGCRACGLCQKRKNAVLGVGPPRADWLVVGEAPGEEEDLAGEPFVGPSGRLLDNMLKAIGLSRRDAEPGQSGALLRANVYIANVLKCRPPFNRNPEPHEVAQCTPYLQRQIELIAPKIILAVGRFAANTLLQGLVEDVERVPLGRLRGKAYSYQNASNTIPVVVTYHPAYLLRNLPAKAQAWEDLCLALQVARQPTQSPAGF